MQETQEIELYNKLKKLLSEMVDFDNGDESISYFSVLIRGIAFEMSEYEDNKGWMKKEKQ